MAGKKFRSLIRPGSSVFTKIFAGLNLIAMPATSGTLKKAVLSNGGYERTYHIYIPSSYNSSVKLPLVIALHGRGGNGESMILLTRGGFNWLADRDGFIAVYPDGIDRGWNDSRANGKGLDYSRLAQRDDAGLLRESNIGTRKNPARDLAEGGILQILSPRVQIREC